MQVKLIKTKAEAMGEEDAYKKLLDKMLRIENVGEIIYKALILKTKDSNLKLIYERLALNEKETAQYIEKEILAMDNNYRASVNAVALRLTKFICCVLLGRQLVWALKSSLKRRAYSKWYNSYKDRNQEFWRILLNHENLQHELLQPFWNN